MVVLMILLICVYIKTNMLRNIDKACKIKVEDNVNQNTHFRLFLIVLSINYCGLSHLRFALTLFCFFYSTGSDMDVCLSNFGHCNYVSPKHACIFYDEVSFKHLGTCV